MKILYCIPTLEYGGAERQLSYLASELSRLGHEVHVACGRRGPLSDRLTAAGVIVHDLPSRSRHDPRLLVALVRLMRKLKPEVVQTSLTQMDIAAGMAALLTGTPWVLREGSAAPCYPRGWKSRVRRIIGRRAGAIVANSPEGDSYWLAVGAHRRYVVNNGVPLAEIDAVGAGKSQETTVLFAGRMAEEKNARTMVESLSRISSEIDFVAVFCGDGPQRAELELLAASRLPERVRFPGYLANIWELMKGAGVLVSLSRYEGAPNVVMEAMACACPLVVSDIAAHRQLLDGDSALFVPFDDADAAAEAITATLRLPVAAQERARIARARAAAQWSIESMARRYEAIYAGLRRIRQGAP